MVFLIVASASLSASANTATEAEMIGLCEPDACLTVNGCSITCQCCDTDGVEPWGTCTWPCD